MQRAINILLIIFSCFPARWLNAQNDRDIDERIEQIVSTLIAESGEGEFLDMNQLRYELEQLADRPVNINSTKMEIFTRIGMLTADQYAALREHIERYDKILDPEELLMIRGFDAGTIKNLKPFITFKAVAAPDEFGGVKQFREARKDLLLHYQQLLEKPVGYTGPEPAYPGFPARMMVRWNFRFYNNWQMGLNLEKDAGERFGWNPARYRLGFDHVSGYLQFRGNKILKTAIIGDFNAGFGQGLTFWKGLTFGKSANSVPIRKVAPGLRPHTGIDEALFLRGIGISAGTQNVTFTGFFSYRKLDATPLTDSTGSPLIFSSLQTSGQHRTIVEIARSHILDETIAGGDISYKNRRFRFGFSYVYRKFGGLLQPRHTLYKIYNFSGRENYVSGFHFGISLNNAQIFGEVSASANRHWAALTGLTLTPDTRFSFTVYTRWFQPAFQPVYSLAFGESSTNKNENGVYLGWEYNPSKKHKLSGFFDLFEFPWLRSNASAPSAGSDILLQYVFRYSKKWEVLLRYRNKKSEINISGITGKLQKVSYHQFRLQFQFKPLENWIFRSRLESVLYYTAIDETGFLIYFDAIYQPANKPYSASIRYAIFDTDSWNSRIYAYERDVYYTYSVKPYSGKGNRVYLNLKWRLKRLFTFVFRIDRTFYPFLDDIGSGNDLIEVNHRTEIKVQIRLRW